jgi:DNA-3-methyladenine glycosylase II
VTALIGSCPHLSRVHAIAGPPPLRRRPKGFKGLARVIVGQQLSVASAGAIWGRLEARVRPFTASSLLSAPDRDLRGAGLSVGKIATLKSLAAAIENGTLDLDALTHAPEEVIHAELTALKGIGPWTADIYILFCLARADA